MVSRARGFSIAEILVALSIIAILSAVLIPALGGHIRRSDAGRIAADLTALQTGIQSFAQDVHRYPGTVGDLMVEITGSGLDVSGSPYPANLTGKWKGPYLERDPFTSLGVVGLNTTFGTLTVLSSTYLTISLTSVPFKDYQNIEEMLDAGTATSTSSTLGAVRYSGTTLTFLALPML